ncbi:hypothetical protein [Pseudonocardia sp. NPDC049635]|uniref:hypothetical protein n=1 Tax=Pseudonocardia sp. NPDC049635 TaxID=3155506 RepID=UPI0033C0D200
MADDHRRQRLQRLGYGIGGGLVLGTVVWTLSDTWWWVVVFLAVGFAVGLFLKATTPPEAGP